jgi:hypothetical protein
MQRPYAGPKPVNGQPAPCRWPGRGRREVAGGRRTDVAAVTASGPLRQKQQQQQEAHTQYAPGGKPYRWAHRIASGAAAAAAAAALALGAPAAAAAAPPAAREEAQCPREGCPRAQDPPLLSCLPDCVARNLPPNNSELYSNSRIPQTSTLLRPGPGHPLPSPDLRRAPAGAPPAMGGPVRLGLRARRTAAGGGAQRRADRARGAPAPGRGDAGDAGVVVHPRGGGDDSPRGREAVPEIPGWAGLGGS